MEPLYFPTLGHQYDVTFSELPDAPIPSKVEKDPPEQALSAPSNGGPGRAKGEGDYAGPERLGLMVLALKDGIGPTAHAFNLRRRTLQGWFEEFGGLRSVRAWLEAEAVAEFLQWELSLYRASRRALDDGTFDKAEVWQTLRKLVEARVLAPAALEAQAPAAAAQANASVTLQVQEKDGETRVIELGPPPEEG